VNSIHRLLAPSPGTRQAAWLLLGATALAAACGGGSFSGTEPSAAQGGDGSSSGGESSRGGNAGSEAGTDSSSAGAPLQAAGGHDAGASGEHTSASGEHTGVAGAPTLLDCAALGGHEHDQHCYVDITTTESLPYASAVIACSSLVAQTGRSSQLLVLDSQAEQDFVLQQLLLQFTDKSDAWLGLTCSAMNHPEFSTCYCTDCDDGQRAEKRALWSWVDGTTADFGWVGQNPNGEGRCSALAFNSANSNWGWVDRNCNKTTHQLTGYPVHDYRTICELE
jgi:hypothetical protein